MQDTSAHNSQSWSAAKLSRTLPGTPLAFNGVPGNIQATLTETKSSVEITMYTYEFQCWLKYAVLVLNDLYTNLATLLIRRAFVSFIRFINFCMLGFIL